MVKKIKEGCIHIYTGPGKGKTTASMGLALRAASSGLKVCMFQFLKKRGSAIENRLKLPNFKVVCFDEVHPLFQGTRIWLGKKILKDLKKVKRVLKAKCYDVIILDEIINCISEKFIDEKNILNLIKCKPKGAELILTGLGASKALIACADYVTQLNKVKHPFDEGLLARRGIEY